MRGNWIHFIAILPEPKMVLPTTSALYLLMLDQKKHENGGAMLNYVSL